MNLKQHRDLAEAAKEEINNPKGRLHFYSTKFYNANQPQTILALLDLVELQHDALQLHGAPFLHHELRYQEAIDAYVAFNKEQ